MRRNLEFAPLVPQQICWKHFSKGRLPSGCAISPNGVALRIFLACPARIPLRLQNQHAPQSRLALRRRAAPFRTKQGMTAGAAMPLRLSKTPGVDKGPQPLMFHPALTTGASERRKTQRLAYLAGFAARERMRKAKPVKAQKSGVQPLFRHADGADVSSAPRCIQGEKTLALTCCAGKRARPACSSAARDSPGAGRPG